MSVNGVTGAQVASVYGTTAKSAQKEKNTENNTKDVGAEVIYDKTTPEKKATYQINRMSANERQTLVKQLKADQESRQKSFLDMVGKMMTGQGKAYSMATGDDSIWQFLASGNFTVDAATKAQAQQDISEDGYWGVKQTSQRLFDFASAIAGDDVEKMQKMQAAMEKGFRQATAAWGKSLPDISQRTMDAANKLFDDYYASKGVTE